MEKYYSIGEVAKLANISIQTLRYYDNIGLFKPTQVDQRTNYRYYNENQLFYLDLIKTMKFLGVSLEEIKEVQNLTPRELLYFLEQQEDVIEQKISRLVEVQHSLFKTKKQMEAQLAIPVFDKVYHKQEEATRILQVATKNLTVTNFTNDYYSTLQKTVEREGSTMNTRYGCLYALKDYEQFDDISYTFVFTPLVTDRYITLLNPAMDVKVIAAGQFICIAFIHTAENYFAHYQKLYHYIVEKQLNVVPIVYETFMPTNYSPNRADEFIVELKVQLT